MTPFSLNIRGRLVRFGSPAVMAIVNITPDSFHAASRAMEETDIAVRTERMLADGADIIDVGACSTRPGASPVSEDEELRRLLPALRTIRGVAGEGVPLSVDTFRSKVARAAVEHGADIVNDISGGRMDSEMFAAVAALGVPYVLMHMRGTPETMQQLTDYSTTGGDVAVGVVAELSEPLSKLRQMGVADVIVDPGFGFAKTLEQNYELLRNLRQLSLLGAPVLAGLSRKSMVTKLLGITADRALEAATALNLAALQNGASILRVHDPAAARQAVKLHQALQG